RAKEVFTVDGGHSRRESGEIKELFAPRKRRQQTILTENQWQRWAVGSGFGGEIHLTMWRRSPCAAIKLWLVNEVSNTSGKVVRPKITTAKTRKVSVGG